MKKAEVIPLDQKKELQVQQDRNMTPGERWNRMCRLVELSIALSGGKPLKPVPPNDPFITLRRK
jgi:hypothetical protein